MNLVLRELICVAAFAAVIVKSCRTVAEYKKKLAEKEAMVESLRVVNHDFKNKMHVLMGYIETDRWDIAKSFINNMRTVPTGELADITKSIKVPALSSLIIGKVIEAKELGIHLSVMPDSRCDGLTPGVAEKDYITIIGNLLQNSIEELEINGDEARCIDLYISTCRDWTIISVSDNGGGMTEEEKQHIFEMGYSTKQGDNRGVGLCVVKKLADKYSGAFEVESEAGEGAVISITLMAKGRKQV